MRTENPTAGQYTRDSPALAFEMTAFFCVRVEVSYQPFLSNRQEFKSVGCCDAERKFRNTNGCRHWHTCAHETSKHNRIYGRKCVSSVLAYECARRFRGKIPYIFCPSPAALSFCGYTAAARACTQQSTSAYLNK